MEASERVEQLSSSQRKDQMEDRASLDFIVCRCFLIVPEEREEKGCRDVRQQKYFYKLG